MIEVAAGVVRLPDGRVLICRRTGELNGLWEFPGGKREPGESITACLERELQEELGLTVRALRPIAEVVRRDGEREIRLIFVETDPLEQEPQLTLRVHSGLAWVRPRWMGSYAFCPGDQAFLDMGLL